MAPRPTLVVLGGPGDLPSLPGLVGFAVVHADPSTLVDQVGPVTGRWLLVGTATDVLVEAVDDVLTGRSAVSGLAGVVVVGTAAGGLRGVPLLEVGVGDDPGPAITRFWETWAGLGPEVPDDFARMLASGRTSARTRGIHARRALADDPAHVPSVLDVTQLATLRVLADRVVPQDGPPVDLAVRVEQQLAAGTGDGWRHADLPVDVEAYRAGLDELSGLADLAPTEQDAALTAVAAGERSTTGSLDAARLSLWFEDARNDLVRQWVAHPATMARIGYDGLANGGDGDRKQGFVVLGAGEREVWEPQMTGTTTGGDR